MVVGLLLGIYDLLRYSLVMRLMSWCHVTSRVSAVLGVFCVVSFFLSVIPKCHAAVMENFRLL